MTFWDLLGIIFIMPNEFMNRNNNSWDAFKAFIGNQNILTVLTLCVLMAKYCIYIVKIVYMSLNILFQISRSLPLLRDIAVVYHFICLDMMKYIIYLTNYSLYSLLGIYSFCTIKLWTGITIFEHGESCNRASTQHWSRQSVQLKQLIHCTIYCSDLVIWSLILYM